MHTHYIGVTIDPVGVAKYIVHDSLTVKCKAVNCKDFKLKFYNNASGIPQDIGLCTTGLEEYPNITTKTCNITVDMRDNGTVLLCGVVRRSGNNFSKELEILVQGQLYINLFNIIIFPRGS